MNDNNSRYRLFWTKFRFYCMKDGFARAKYLKKKNVLREMGDNIYFYSRVFPADPELLKLHNNISIATNVRFINHDRIDIMLNGMHNDPVFREKYKMYDEFRFRKKYGCIEILDNVFIGADSIILPGVKIGPNAIVAAGSVVSKDVEEGTIVGGSPARPIGSFDKLVKRRAKHPKGSHDVDKLWENFDYHHSEEYQVEMERRRAERDAKRARRAARRMAKAAKQARLAQEAMQKEGTGQTDDAVMEKEN